MKYCSKASEEWIQLMCDLRTAILDARTELNVALADEFEAKDELQFDCLEVDLLTRSWDPSVDVDHMIYEIFENRGLLKETGLHPIERECFEKCIKLLREAEIKMGAEALSA
ncbi:hypothetical protein BCV69DRAFT_283579 [Microstroma glucosiphilum]|uniref:Uncharacterized protein n=1 Tax=Pseudomicrostroma glucosiphilum TaxID=1684307 RepID=A0A316U5D7_9BASI|nr:hypothetical protein BCV69DRAFT_283579 [Pseudomicrostroma glucosiphilum]PWN20048.1 hypothetical protein BCV69DRAFT_283579 [Pseudomicrostroma glucosiphilum]